MALECLCSDVIISNEERNTTRRFKRNSKANFFRIHRRRLIQFNVNPQQIGIPYFNLIRKMQKIPKGTYKIEITAEMHMAHVSYTVNFENSERNNLKTYYF